MLQLFGSQGYYHYREGKVISIRFDSLAGLVLSQLGKSPTSGEVFICYEEKGRTVWEIPFT